MCTFTRTRPSDWNKVYKDLYELGIPLATAKATDWISAISKLDDSYEPSELWNQIFTPDEKVTAKKLLTCILTGIGQVLASLCGPAIANHFPLTFWEVDGILTPDTSAYLTRDGFPDFLCLSINTTYVSIMEDWGLFNTGEMILLRNMFNPIPLTNVIIRAHHPDSDFPDTLQNAMPIVWPQAPFGFFHIMTFYVCAVYKSRSCHPWGIKDGIRIFYNAGDEPLTLVNILRKMFTSIEYLKIKRSGAVRKIQRVERHRQYCVLMKTIWRVLNTKARTRGLFDHVKKCLTNN